MSWTLRCLLSLSILLVLPHCTDNSPDNANPMNADGSLGAKPRDFFQVKNSNEISVVRITAGKEARRFVFQAPSTLTDLGSLSMDRVKVSLDGKYITIIGETGLFEYQNVNADSLGTSSVVLAPTALEGLCIVAPDTTSAQFGNASFQELHILKSDAGHRLVGLTPGESQTLGGEAALATKAIDGILVSYTLSGFGTLQINTSQTFANDAGYFQTSVANLYCHLDHVNPFHMLFITQALRGDLGGLAGADATCEAYAKSGSKTNALPGKWRAILSDSSTDAKDRISLLSGAPVVNAQGETLVSSSAPLWAGTLTNAVKYNQNGAAPGGHTSGAWTGSNADGTRVGDGYNCDGWGSSGGWGMTGSFSDTGSTWLFAGNFGGDSCNSQGGKLYEGIYCINTTQ